MAERRAKTNAWIVTTIPTSKMYTAVATGTASVASAKAREDEDQAEHDEQQHVAGEHVGEESHGKRDQAHELRDHLEGHDERKERLRRAGRDPALEVLDGAVVADALHVGREEGHEREGERDAEVRRGRVDPKVGSSRPKSVEVLVRERQRDEPDHVQDPDEEEERGAVGEPHRGRLLRQVALGDLPLERVVDALADRLPPPRAQRAAEAHDPDPEQDGDEPAEPDVGDRLVHGQVDRADLDRDPRVEGELLGGIEVAGGGEQEPFIGAAPRRSSCSG